MRTASSLSDRFTDAYLPKTAHVARLMPVAVVTFPSVRPPLQVNVAPPLRTWSEPLLPAPAQPTLLKTDGIVTMGVLV